MPRAACTLLIGLGVLLAACGEPARDDIRIGIQAAPATLDPRYASDAVSARLARLVHRAPVRLDATGRAVPDLADWERLAPRRYRVTLRPDARFTDGRPVRAADLVATYDSVLDPGAASPLRGALANVRALRAVTPRRVDFELIRPDPAFPATLTIGVLAARDLAAGAARDAWRASSGPFELVERALDGRTRLRRRRDGMVFTFLPSADSTTRALRLLAGELDIVQGNLAPEIHAWLSTRAGLVGLTAAGSTYAYLGFNFADPVTARREVRLAVAHALDRATIVRHLFRGAARPAASLFPPGHWLAPATLSAPAHDPARARALLAALGHGPARPLRLTYKTSSDPFRLRLATVLQSQLAAVGIDLVIESHDWGTFYGDVTRGRFQLYGLSWIGLALPDIFRQAFHSASAPPAGANRGAYRAPAVDRLIEAAEAATDPMRQRALYHELQRRLLDDLPYVPLWYEDQLAVVRADIVGYALDAESSFDALGATRRTRADERRRAP